MISIVLPTYNRAHVLGRAVDSVLAQTYSEWELIIVDNHSSDQTDHLIENYHNSKIKLYKINNEGIIAKSRNLGILHAQGEFVAFLDSDDWWCPRKLELSLKCLQSFNADIVYHDLYQVKPKKQKLFLKKIKTRNLISPVFKDLLQNGNAIANSSVVVRKQLLEKIGLISEEQKKVTWEDYDTWLRLAKITEDFKRIPQTLGYYWSGNENLLDYDQSLQNNRSFSYFYNLRNLNNNIKVWWLYYSSGCVHYCKGEYSKAYDNFRRMPVSPFEHQLKKYYMMFICCVRLKLKSSFFQKCND